MNESRRFNGKLFEFLLILLLTGMNSYSFLINHTYAHFILYFLVISSFILMYAWDSFKCYEVKKIILLFIPALLYGYINSIFGKNYTATLTAVMIAILAILMGCKTEIFGHNNVIILYRIYCIGMLASTTYYMDVYHSLGTYGYALKNNYAPMVLFAVVLLYIDHKVIPNLLLRWCLILYYSYIIMMLRCRSVVVCFILLICFRIIHFVFGKIIRLGTINSRAFLAAILAFILIVLFYEQIYNLISYGLKLEQYEEMGIEGYGGSRLVLAQNGYVFWKTNLFTIIFGSSEVGRVECFYLSTLFARGAIGLILFLIPLFYGLRKTVFQNISFLLDTENNSKKILAALMFTSSLIIGIFEAGAPFSQGTTFFIMWFTMGVYLHNTDTCGEIQWD